MGKGFTQTQDESDSTTIRDVLTIDKDPPWNIDHMVVDIKSLRTQLSSFTVLHCFHECNQ